MAHDVFISYSSKDKPTSDAVCAVLESAGIRCWIAPRDVSAGQNWGQSIVGAIKHARIMVLVFSAHANYSPQIAREVERAVSRGVTIIPFRIEEVAPASSLEYFISTSHWLDAFTPPLEKHLQHLAQMILKILGRLPEGIEADSPPEQEVATNLGRADKSVRSTLLHTWSVTSRILSVILHGVLITMLLFIIIFIAWMFWKSSIPDLRLKYPGSVQMAYHDLSLPEDWPLHRVDTIGLGTFPNSKIVYSAEVVEVSGKGDLL